MERLKSADPNQTAELPSLLGMHVGTTSAQRERSPSLVDSTGLVLELSGKMTADFSREMGAAPVATEICSLTGTDPDPGSPDDRSEKSSCNGDRPRNARHRILHGDRPRRNGYSPRRSVGLPKKRPFTGTDPVSDSGHLSGTVPVSGPGCRKNVTSRGQTPLQPIHSRRSGKRFVSGTDPVAGQNIISGTAPVAASPVAEAVLAWGVALLNFLVWLPLSLALSTPLALALEAPAPEDTPVPNATLPGIKFELDIQPILTARGCNSGPCHGKSRGQNGFALSLLGFDSDMDYRSIVTDARGRRVTPASPTDSLLLQKATAQLPHGGGKKLELDSPDYQTLVQWIQTGFQRTSESDPVLTQVTILPQPKPLAPGEELKLHVTATYSDGTTRDVTSTSAYQSNEPAVLAVKPDGKIRAGSLPGEATIMARYMGNIATWSSAIPRPDRVDPKVYAELPRKNFIDEMVYERLSQLNIVPSQPASDSQFLRRAFIDVIGRQPTSEETRSFLQDPNPDKRNALINTLLDRPEYADNWANKWADLLRPNPYRVGIKAVLSLDTWIRDAFRQNLPYDQFVRGILTARGSNWKNGAVTIFRDRREPDEIVTMVSQLFLGIRLDCAKCHQHPFEVYGQHDFYSLAAFFSRVGYKGTGLSPPISGGEETVLVKSSGEVKHPLTGKPLTPKTLRGAEVPVAEGDDPREKLVDWMVSETNPTFAQVAVNRVWADLFGVGIVDPVDDLRATNPPSNPKLLDQLSAHFRTIGFNQKELLRTILQSHVYSLSSDPNETNRGDHRNFSRHYRQRLRAEVLADAICDITETTQSYAGTPTGTRAMQLWTVRSESEMLDAFGRPDPNQDPPCERIPESTVVQALHLMNAPAIASKITDDNGRAKRLAASDNPPEKIIEDLYLATFSRFPDPGELSDLASEFGKPNNDRRKLVEDILWSMLNSPEFTHKD